MVYRIYVEKKKELANEAKALFFDIFCIVAVDNAYVTYTLDAKK